MAKRLFFLAAIAFSFELMAPSGSVAQESPRTSDDGLNEVAAAIVQETGVPGMILAVLDHSEIVAIGCAGIRKAGSPERITIDDHVHLGSCTKAMTATLMAVLVEDGRLAWNSTIGEVLPELRGKIHAEYLPVTLEQLLAHRGSIPANAKNWWLKRADPIAARREIIIQSLTNPPSKPVGSQFLYSNLGYVLAAHMAEQVCGKSWEEIIREELFDPLAMSTAGFGPPNTPDQVDQPWGHVPKTPSTDGDGKFRPLQSDNAAALGPAGTVHCSVEDWCKFLNLHLHPEVRPDLLAVEKIQRLHTPDPHDATSDRRYAGGWIVDDKNPTGATTLAHSGSNKMWIATVRLVPSRGIGLVAAVNAGGADAKQAADKGIRRLYERFLPPSESRPNESTPKR